MLILGISIVNALSMTKSEYVQLTDRQIANYMLNTYKLNSIGLNNYRLTVYYNITYVTENRITDKIETKVLKYPTYLDLDDVYFCLFKYTNTICKQAMITNSGTYNYTNNGILHKSKTTYQQGYDRGLIEYNNAIKLRDKLRSNMNNEVLLKNFIGNITK